MECSQMYACDIIKVRDLLKLLLQFRSYLSNIHQLIQLVQFLLNDMQICKYANMQICKCTNMQMCKYANVQICKHKLYYQLDKMVAPHPTLPGHHLLHNTLQKKKDINLSKYHQHIQLLSIFLSRDISRLKCCLKSRL